MASVCAQAPTCLIKPSLFSGQAHSSLCTCCTSLLSLSPCPGVLGNACQPLEFLELLLFLYMFESESWLHSSIWSGTHYVVHGSQPPASVCLVTRIIDSCQEYRHLPQILAKTRDLKNLQQEGISAILQSSSRLVLSQHLRGLKTQSVDSCYGLLVFVVEHCFGTLAFIPFQKISIKHFKSECYLADIMLLDSICVGKTLQRQECVVHRKQRQGQKQDTRKIPSPVAQFPQLGPTS